MSQSPFQTSTGTNTNPPLCVLELLFQNIPPRSPYPWECVLGLFFAFLGPCPSATNPSGSTAGICWDQSEAPRRKIHTEVPFMGSRGLGMCRIFREGLLFSCQRLLINTGSSFMPRAEPANSWHLWMWGRKVLGFEGKGLGESWSDWEGQEFPQQGWDTRRSHSGACGGQEGLAGTVRAQIRSKYSWLSQFVLSGSKLLSRVFCCGPRG